MNQEAGPTRHQVPRASRTVRDMFLLFLRHLGLGIFMKEPEQTKQPFLFWAPSLRTCLGLFSQGLSPLLL